MHPTTKRPKRINWRAIAAAAGPAPAPEPDIEPAWVPIPAMRPVVPGFVGEGLTIIAGREKVGKSWLALDLAVAVARGGRALQSVDCERGAVIYIDTENGYRRLKQRLERIAPGGIYEELQNEEGRYAPASRTDMSLIWCHGDFGDDLIKHFETWRQSRPGLRLIVFDAGKRIARAAARGSVADRAQRAAVIASLESVQRWAIGHGIAVLCVARTAKGGDAVLNRLFGLADATLLIERRDGRVALRVRSRDADERSVALAFDAGLFTVVGDAIEEQRSFRRSQILEVLETCAAPVSAVDVAGSLGLPYANVRKLLYNMTRSGEVQRASRGLFVHCDVARESAVLRSQRSQMSESAAKSLS